MNPNKLKRYIWNRLLCRPRMKSLKQKINEQWATWKYDVYIQSRIEDVERETGAHPLFHTTLQMYHDLIINQLKPLKNEIYLTHTTIYSYPESRELL